MEPLSEGQRQAVIACFHNVLAMFTTADQIKSTHAKCMMRWALQLGISPDSISTEIPTVFRIPDSRTEKIRSTFHLVLLICLDHRIEDDEIDLAMLYADRIGLNRTLIGGLFQSISTAGYDEMNPDEMERQIVSFFDEYHD